MGHNEVLCLTIDFVSPWWKRVCPVLGIPFWLQLSHNQELKPETVLGEKPNTARSPMAEDTVWDLDSG